MFEIINSLASIVTLLDFGFRLINALWRLVRKGLLSGQHGLWKNKENNEKTEVR